MMNDSENEYWEAVAVIRDLINRGYIDETQFEEHLQKYRESKSKIKKP